MTAWAGTINTLVSWNGTAWGTVYNSASFTPTADSLLVFIMNVREGSTSLLPTLDVSGFTDSGGLTWTLRSATSNNMGVAGNKGGVAIFTAPAGSSPTATSVQYTPGTGAEQWSYGTVIFEITGLDTANPLVQAIAMAQNASAGGSNSLSMATGTLASAPTSGNLVVAMFGSANATVAAYTAISGWTQLINQDQKANHNGVWYNTATTATSVTCTDLGDGINYAGAFLAEFATASTTTTVSADASLAQASTLTATSVETVPAAAALDQASALSAGATPTRLAAVALAQSSTLAVSADLVLPAAAALAQGSTLAVASVESVPVAATLIQVSTLTAGPVVTRQGAVALTQASALTVAAVPTRLAAATLDQASTLSVTSGSVGTTSAAASLTQSSALSAGPVVSRLAAVALQQASTLATAATVVRLAAASLPQASTLTTGATVGNTQEALLAQASALSVASTAARLVAVALAQPSALASGTTATRLFAAALAQASTLTVAGSVNLVTRDITISATLTRTWTALLLASGRDATLTRTWTADLRGTP